MSAISEITQPNRTLTGNFNGQSLKLRQITVKEYDDMIETGVFDENDQVELLNGAIVEKMPKRPQHSAATDRITRVFYRHFGERVLSEIKIRFGLMNFPNPNLILS